MSAISEKVRKALYAKLNVSGVTSIASGVYESQAPADASFPYVIFQRQAPGEVVRSFSGLLQLEQDLWLIKAVADASSTRDNTQSPQETAEEIVIACETAIGASLTLSGNTVVWCQRFADMPPYQQDETDDRIFHRGFLLRVCTN
jgi:hypothetical protein